MIVKSINYQEVFNTGSYTSKRIGLDGELEPGESAADGYAKAYKQVHDFFNSLQPAQEVITAPPAPIPEVQHPKAPLSKEDRLIGQINECSDIVVLESFSKLAKLYPGSQAAFEKKLQSLKK